MPGTSIIVVSHNGLHETTAPCLRSIFGHTTGMEYEVVAVDNNSTDGTVAYLTDLMVAEPRLRCVFNSSNRGFAGGNNDGIRIATGDFLVLLNSDTMVTPGWLNGLLAPLSKDRTVGMTGPVSNSVGNEQRIFTSGTDAAAILDEGLSWVRQVPGGSFETEMLGFFCVALRRDVVEKVGLLDEDFGTGFYEDDDYCIRVKNAGYKLLCVENVFVYHRGGGTFGKLENLAGRLMKENKEKLKKKHHWNAKRIHPRYRQIKVIEDYMNKAGQAGLTPDLQFKISNRMKLIESHAPRGLFKRMLFRRTLGKLKSRLESFRFPNTKK
jgi:GT2 family glycosyltransferase